MRKGARYLEPPPAQLVLQNLQVGRKVAVRSKLDPLIARLGDFVQKSFPRRLAGIIHKPDSPGVWRAAYFDVHGLVLRSSKGPAGPLLELIGILKRQLPYFNTEASEVTLENTSVKQYGERVWIDRFWIKVVTAEAEIENTLKDHEAIR